MFWYFSPQELRAKIKDPDKLNEELDKNHSQYLIKINMAISQEKENTRKQLSKKTDLSEAEVRDVRIGVGRWGWMKEVGRKTEDRENEPRYLVKITLAITWEKAALQENRFVWG